VGHLTTHCDFNMRKLI